MIANAKREIDRLNIGRHRMVQEIDAAFDASLDQQATAPLATESPGMVLDRLSVLVIRRAGRPPPPRTTPATRTGSGRWSHSWPHYRSPSTRTRPS